MISWKNLPLDRVFTQQFILFQLQKQAANETEMKYAKTVADLESQVNHYMDSASKLQTEVDRLLNMIRTHDSDKLDKDNQIQELEEWVLNQCLDIDSDRGLNGT